MQAKYIKYHSETQFQVNSAVSTNRDELQWINLGIQMEVCMTHPESCGAAGGAIHLWFRVNKCPLAGAIVTTVSNTSAGYHIYFIGRSLS